MNPGDVAKQKKVSAPLIRWAKTLIEADDVLTMAADFLGKLDAYRGQRDALVAEIAALSADQARRANEFHVQEKQHAVARAEFEPDICKVRAAVHAERAKAEAQISGYADQVTTAREKHATHLAVFAEELLKMEELLGAAVGKYNEFKKEITSHG